VTAQRRKGAAKKKPKTPEPQAQVVASSSLVWHTEQRRVGDLVEWEANPRQLTEKQAEDLRESLHRFGYVEPVAIDTDGKIVGGHQRRRMLLDAATVARLCNSAAALLVDRRVGVFAEGGGLNSRSADLRSRTLMRGRDGRGSSMSMMGNDPGRAVHRVVHRTSVFTH
jgi:hypothetical protein